MGRPQKNWNLFLTVVSMGLSINHASEMMKIHRNSVYQFASRNPEFREKLDEALARQMHCLQIDPHFFVHPIKLTHILDENLEKLPRRPPRSLLPWIHEQMLKNPLRQLA